jgi:hypothetical protein
MKPSIRILRDDHSRLDKILNEVQKFKVNHVAVGVFEGTQRRGTGQSRAIMMAMIAAVQEYGSPKRGIPERSYIRKWVSSHKEEIVRFIKKLLGEVEDGKMTADQALKKLGAFGVAGIRKQIRETKDPPLKAATIAKKGSSQPLIDTGQLRNSFQYKLVKK